MEAINRNAHSESEFDCGNIPDLIEDAQAAMDTLSTAKVDPA